VNLKCQYPVTWGHAWTVRQVRPGGRSQERSPLARVGAHERLVASVRNKAIASPGATVSAPGS